MDFKEIYNIYKEHPIVTTDSRNCPNNSIFIALKGANFNGNKFAKTALENGCSYAIVDDKDYYDSNSPQLILVEDSLITYKKIAQKHREEFHIPIIGITGTNGKTTSKELISTVLTKKFNVLHTEGNFNNDIGVPKTLLRINHTHNIAVIEMGASHQGDIKKLVEYVEPTCGLITNVGYAHLEGFGSFEGVKKTKGELYDYLKTNNCLLFLNNSNKNLVKMAEDRHISNLTTYGQNSSAHIQGEFINCNPFLNFKWKSANNDTWHEVKTHLIGSYNIDNLLAAIAIGVHFNISDEDICHALENYIPNNNRSQLIKTKKNNLIVDAYNANPSSMKAAIDNFKIMDVKNKMLILGDMNELGESSAIEHQKIIELINNCGLSNVWLVGDKFKQTNSTFKKFKDITEVKEYIKTNCPVNQYILIKGSNTIRLFELSNLL